MSHPTIQVGNKLYPDVRGLYPDVPAYGKRELSAIRRIIVHHSVTAGEEATEEAELRTMQAFHGYHQAQGWPGIGYHAVVFWSGRVYVTGGAEDVRYHASQANVDSYGICLVGDFTVRWPSAPQLGKAREFIGELRYGLGTMLPVVGHKDVMQTQCPGNTWSEWRDQLEQPALPPTPPDNLAQALALLSEAEERIARARALLTP